MSETYYRDLDAYRNLPKSRQMLLDTVMGNLESGTLWKKNWSAQGAPVTFGGTPYRGENNLLLTLTAMNRGYTDTRWLTFNQMAKAGYHFKDDGHGSNMGRGAGVPVFYFELHDRVTGSTYDRETTRGMSEDEREDYIKENVFPFKKTYTVFNADVIEGIEKAPLRTDMNRSDRADRFIESWTRKVCPVKYGGDSSMYSPSADVIHMPPRENFADSGEYYVTMFHEMAHSTGHSGRLSRPLSLDTGSRTYALEELRAEITSMFMCQEFGVGGEMNVRNNSAYIKAWYERIGENPEALFDAVQDADRITRFSLAVEERASEKDAVATASENSPAAGRAPKKSETPEAAKSVAPETALKSEGKGKIIGGDTPAAESEPKDISSVSSGESGHAGAEGKRDGEEKKAENMAIPSACKGGEEQGEEEGNGTRPRYMTYDIAPGCGPSGLSEEDRKLYEKSKKSWDGEKLSALYGGYKPYWGDINGRALMSRLADTIKDEDALLRIFRSSKQYDESVGDGYYIAMAEKVLSVAPADKKRMISAAGEDKRPGAGIGGAHPPAAEKRDESSPDGGAKRTEDRGKER